VPSRHSIRLAPCGSRAPILPPFFTRTHDIAGGVDTRGVQFWFVAVRSLIAMIPPVLLALLAQRYIVRGLTLGAVKG
jgi:ABC-type glycerol-3-phosphate transport system permease component